MVSLPAYHTLEATKKRKERKILVSSNWYRNAHYFDKNKVKQYYNELARLKLLKLDIEPLKGMYTTRMVYYYKNSSSDGSNVTSMMEKFFLDTLQEYGYVEQDSVLFHNSDGFRCVRDSKNPRVEIEVYQDVRRWEDRPL